MSNLSPSTTYIVENPEGAGEFVKVAPRRLDMPVPFEFARVVLPAEKGWASFMVFAPEHAYADAELLERPSGEQTVAPFPLDETAKYFLVLVALCEPRLRDSSTVVIPSAPEIVARLRGLEPCKGLTRAPGARETAGQRAGGGCGGRRGGLAARGAGIAGPAVQPRP